MDCALPLTLARCPFCDGYSRITPTSERPEEGWILWSDGTLWHPYFALYERVMRCGHCHRFFLVDFLNTFLPTHSKGTPRAEFVSLRDLAGILEDVSVFEALAPHVNLTLRNKHIDIAWKREDLEESIKRAIVTKYNDLFRLGREKEIDEDLRKIFVANAEWLLKRGKMTSSKDPLLRAELHRNLGNFAECKDEMKEAKEVWKHVHLTNGEAYRDFKLKMLIACWQGDKNPFAVAEAGDGFSMKKMSFLKRMKWLFGYQPVTSA
ncbi:MAG TPA: hypothetical protein VFE50_16535 [Cyclobacteriaceae bacterium]|nr:hypothetical protein [Cyclobacteriaceae bacterium]